MNGLAKVIFETMPLGVLVIDKELKTVFLNRTGRRIFSRVKVPREISVIAKRIFQAISEGAFHRYFPGEIIVSKRMERCPNIWTLEFYVHFGTVEPHVIVYINEEKVSRRVNLSELRNTYSLTRRETDVVRRLLDGLKNSQIGEDLNVSEQTVKEHLKHIYTKLGVNNRLAVINALLSTANS